MIEHRAAVVGAILAVGAFLEATINELFETTAKPAEPTRSKGLNALHQVIVERVWSIREIRRLPLRARYQLALALTIQNTGIADEIDDVLLLRNTLVHFSPSWVTVLAPEPVAPQELERRLSHRFIENRLAGRYPGTGSLAVPFFPDRCLGYGCARWAVDSARQFTDDFFSRLRTTPRYASIPDAELDPDRWRLL